MEREKLIAVVKAVQNGESEAAAELYDSFYQDIYFFIRKNVKDPELAADLTQESFIEILQTIGSLQEPAAFVSWSRQIAYHKCTAHFRKRRELLADEDEDGHSVFDTVAEEREEFIPDEALEKDELKKTILAMIDSLPQEQRAAILMRYYEEISIKEIAQIQGVSEGTVKSRLNYGRKAIRQSIEDFEKKHDVRLHCVGVVPVLLWLFRDRNYFAGLFGAAGLSGTAAAAGAGAATAAGAGAAAVAAGTGAAVGTGAATAVAAGATTAGLLSTKLVAGILAVTVVAGGASLAFGIHRSKTAPPTATTAQTLSLETSVPTATTQPPDALQTEPVSTVPEETIPEETVPEETAPEETVPEETVPEETVPEETVPEETVPEETIPEETVPEETEPEADNTGDLTFTLSDDGTCYTVAGTNRSVRSMEIPSVYNGLPVTAIADSGFIRYVNLSSISIPNSVTSIGREAFFSCWSLSSVTIPASVTHIGSMAFSACKNLETIRVEAGNSAYHSSGNCLIKTAGGTLIAGCQNSVIPSDGSVTHIGDYAFFSCGNLTSITIPGTVTTIGYCAFHSCESLTSVTISRSVTSIESQGFFECTALTDIHYTGTMEQWAAISKAPGWDSGTPEYTVHCSDGDITKSGG